MEDVLWPSMTMAQKLNKTVEDWAGFDADLVAYEKKGEFAGLELSEKL